MVRPGAVAFAANSIPDDAEPGLYELGGTTTYRSQPLREINPQRVRVQE